MSDSDKCYIAYREAVAKAVQSQHMRIGKLDDDVREFMDKYRPVSRKKIKAETVKQLCRDCRKETAQKILKKTQSDIGTIITTRCSGCKTVREWSPVDR